MKLSEKFDWSDLQLLLVVSSTGYVTDTATKLGIDPTTITRRLRRLEKRVGMKLIERVKGGVVLSADCEKLVTLARSLSRELDSTFPDSTSESGLHGTVRVTITDFLVDLLLDRLVDFQAKHPGIAFDINESYARQSINNRETDIAVRITEEPHEGLVGVRLGGLQFSIYGLARYKRKRVSGWPWISWSLAQYPHDEWIADYDPKGRIVMRSGSLLTHARLADMGVGVAVLPDVYVEGRAALPNLVKIKPVWDPQSLWVLTHAELRNVPRIQQSMRALSAALKTAISGNT